MDKLEAKTVYGHFSNGYFAGEQSDYGGPMPHNCVSFPPEIKDGFIPKLNAEKNGWEQEENHKGEKGYVNGVFTEIY